MSAERKPQSSAEWREYAKRVAPLLDQVCHLCGGDTFDKAGPWQRTVDHLHPISAGGELCPPIELLRIAHRCCNTARGNRARALSVVDQRTAGADERNRVQTRARYQTKRRRELAAMPALFETAEDRERAALDRAEPVPVGCCTVCGKPIMPSGKRGRPRTKHRECDTRITPIRDARDAMRDARRHGNGNARTPSTDLSENESHPAPSVIPATPPNSPGNLGSARIEPGSSRNKPMQPRKVSRVVPSDEGEMPEPRIATPTPADVTGSYGAEAEEWAAVHLGYRLRPWQRFALERALEHRADGSLRWPNILLTVSRQSGKTILIPALCGWRCSSADVFGEPQKAVSIANQLSTARLPWRVAERRSDEWGAISRLRAGEERIEWPSRSGAPEPDGVWLVQAANRNAGVGHSCGLVVADEAWNIDRAVIEAALAPSQLERIDPQLYLISTAGDGTSDLFAEHRALAIGQLSNPDTAETLILEWSSAPDADLDDRSAWRDASPHWNERRLERLERLYRSTSPTDFRRQYLNQWVSGSAHSWVSDLAWLRCRDDARALPRGFGSVAIESHLAGEPFGWVQAVLDEPSGEVVVRAGIAPSRRELWHELARIAESAPGVRIIHPEGFRHHVPPMPRAGEVVRVTPSETFASYAATVTAIKAGGVIHSGQAILTEQVLSAVAYSVADRGSTLSSRASTGPIYLARALVWAVGHELRPNQNPRPLIVAG